MAHACCTFCCVQYAWMTHAGRLCGEGLACARVLSGAWPRPPRAIYGSCTRAWPLNHACIVHLACVMHRSVVRHAHISMQPPAKSQAFFALHSRAMSDARALRAWRVQGARAMHARRVNRACVMRGWRGRVAAAQCIASLVGARPFSEARTTRAWQLVTLPMVGPASIVA